MKQRFQRISHGYMEPCDWKGCGYFIVHDTSWDGSVYRVYKETDCNLHGDGFLDTPSWSLKRFDYLIEAKVWCRDNAIM